MNYWLKTKILFCLLLLASSLPTTAPAAPKLNVAITFSNLVRGIPNRIRNTVSDPNRIIEVNGKYHVLYPGVIELGRLLEKNPDISLSILVSDEEKEVAAVALAKISETFSSLQKTEIPSGWNPKNSLIFTTSRSKANASQETRRATLINPFSTYYYFESLEKSTADAAKAEEHTEMFPGDKKSLQASLHHFELFYLELLSCLHSGASLENMTASIQNAATPKSRQLVFLQEWSAAHYAKEAFQLEVESSNIRGCSSLKFNPVNLTINKQVLSAAIASCLQFIKEQEKTFAWLEEERQNCGEFYNGYFFSKTNVADCAADVVAEKTVSGYTFSANLDALNLRQLNKKPSVVKSVSLPRTSAPIFRGIGQSHFHYNPAAILRGLLRTSEYVMPSRLFDKLQSKDQISVSETVKLLKNYFSSQPVSSLNDQYVDGASGSYKNYADDALFGTFFYIIAEYYAKNLNNGNGIVIAFHDYYKRGIDLNYAMDKLGNANKDIDAGEYLMPLLISGSEMDGMIFPETQHAYFQVYEGGERYILVYKDAGCMFKDLQKIYNCKSKSGFKFEGKDYSVHEEPQTAVGVAAASAVIKVCKQSDSACNAPNDAFMKKYSVRLSSEFPLDIDLSSASDQKNRLKAFWKH